ncbi:hypothetical protein T11_1523 [Trichinella zimbabwensis]|uniref:DUF5641 domain-containing protein n=1 Tax=Trichinella zimbabwensis TaxID=268475 RepID=A0A0V1I6P4_9BILA|nr:hypothetical protein T11_1523 [Trichinella zimbabwensis]
MTKVTVPSLLSRLAVDKERLSLAMEQFCQLCDAQAPEDGIAEELQFVEELYREKKKSQADFETSLGPEERKSAMEEWLKFNRSIREIQDAGTSDNELAARLPQYELPKFNGDFTQFRSLWDQFENCVHQRPSLSNAAKLAYLRSCLSRKALVAITCLCSRKSDYEVALECAAMEAVCRQSGAGDPRSDSPRSMATLFSDRSLASRGCPLPQVEFRRTVVVQTQMTPAGRERVSEIVIRPWSKPSRGALRRRACGLTARKKKSKKMTRQSQMNVYDYGSSGKKDLQLFNPCLDNDEIQRVGGRLALADLSRKTENSMLLPHDAGFHKKKVLDNQRKKCGQRSREDVYGLSKSDEDDQPFADRHCDHLTSASTRKKFITDPAPWCWNPLSSYRTEHVGTREGRSSTILSDALVERKVQESKEEQPRVGDIVLVVEPTLPVFSLLNSLSRRIVELHYCHDRVARSAKVQTERGLITRSVRSLVLLDPAGAV